MAMRMTGLMSGMDTESIIQELVSVRKTKVDTAKKAQTKLSWQQDAWKSLNTKLKNLQNKIGNMRFSTDYAKKTTKVSNSNAVSVITGEDAMYGVQELEVNQLAKTAYLTGGKVKTADNSQATAMSTLKDLGYSGGNTTITVGDKELNVNGSTTISDVLNFLKDESQGNLNASFDANQQRLYISAKESGADGNFSIGGDADVLNALGLGTVKSPEEVAGDADYKGAVMTKGQDAIITLNGARYENSNNTFEINGLTLTALSETKGETVSISTEQDTDGIYDMVKDFLKAYNEVVNEMDKMYNAASAKGYDPLTSEEKDAMTDSEIEEWETKVKDALLRRDSNLSTVNSTLQDIMAGGLTVNGKTMYLFDFGIETPSYFTAPDNEKHAYHIDGDADDTLTANNADKLKSMISNDPDTVISFFTQLSRSLYTKMDELSASVDGYRSYGSFYDDKKMKADYDDYTSKIADLESKLNDYEDKWYKKFSAMETALSKMQSNVSAVTSLLGG